MFDGGFAPKQRGEAADLSREGGTDVLRVIGGEVSHAREYSSQDNVAIQKLGET